MSSLHRTSLFASVLSVCVCVSSVCLSVCLFLYAQGCTRHRYAQSQTHTATHTFQSTPRHANKHTPPNTTTNSLPFALQEMVFNMAVPRVLPGWHNVTVWPSLNVSGPKTTSRPCHIPRQDHPAASSKLSVGELRNLSLSLLCSWQIQG